jgi:hypothetical protein
MYKRGVLMGIFNREKNEIIVKQFNNQDKNSGVALLQFKGDIKTQIIKELNSRLLLRGEYIETGAHSSVKTISTLISAGAGSVGLSGVMSGQLFMATANPATLMTIGNGVGSAVMGAGGIVAQAPFIPLAGAIMPVAAPLIAFQAISTIAILNEFKVVNKKLDNIKNLVERIIERDEATNIGIIFSALNRLDEIEEQFNITKSFNEDMIIRINLLENSINPLFERYNHLYASANKTVVEEQIKYDKFGDKLLEIAANPWVTGILSLLAQNELDNRPKTKLVVSPDDAKFKRRDAYFTILTSILDIRISNLRVKLNIQESPEYIQYSINDFQRKINIYKLLWLKIKDNYKEIEDISKNIEDALVSMNWWEKNMPPCLAGKRKERIEKENALKIMQEDNIFNQQSLNKFIDETKDSIRNIEQNSPSNLLFWKDDFGEHSYYTNDLLIK